MRLFASTPPNEYKIEIANFSDSPSIHLDGKPIQATLTKISDSAFFLLLNNRSYQLVIEKSGRSYIVRLHNRAYRIEVEDERSRRLRKTMKAVAPTNTQLEVKAPMPGLLVKVNVTEGQQIKKGDSLAIIEAMKMENEIRAAADGRIKKIFKKEKESVEKDMVLLLVE